jgi:hypothetical protein
MKRETHEKDTDPHRPAKQVTEGVQQLAHEDLPWLRQPTGTPQTATSAKMRRYRPCVDHRPSRLAGKMPNIPLPPAARARLPRR